MFHKIIVRLSFLVLLAFSLNQAYSVLSMPLTVPCAGHLDTLPPMPYEASTNCQNFVQDRLDAAHDAGFNTIDFVYLGALPGVPEGALNGHKWRDHYKAFIYQVLSDPHNFNLTIRVDAGARSLYTADNSRWLTWNSYALDYNPDYFLKHAPIDSPNVAFTEVTDPTAGVGPWDPYLDFYGPDTYIRHRTVDPWNPYVRGIIRDLWSVVIQDVMEVADSIGGTAPQRVLWFTLLWNSTGESEYQHDFLSGNVNGAFYQDIYGFANDNPDRIDWIQERQDSLATFHGEFSDTVKAVRDRSAGYDFHFGAQWSGVSIGTSLMRGHIDLARLASHLNSGDWIHVADIADTRYPVFNHNFSMDYTRSIASVYGLHISNECSWPTFLTEQFPVSDPDPATLNETNDAYRQQAVRSLNHGAAAFFVTNWTTDDGFPYFTSNYFAGGGGDPAYFIPYVSQNYASSETAAQQKGKTAIFVDPWALYAAEDRSGTNVYGNPVYAAPNMYSEGVLKELYDTLSNNGAERVDILTPQLLTDSPGIVNDYNRVYLPSLDSVLSSSALDTLIKGRYKSNLTLMNTRVGVKDKYQSASTPVNVFLADDLLWADKTNKYPLLSGYEDPALQVALSTGSGIGGASPWSGYLYNYSQGMYVGDFNGDGRDDLMNYTYGADIEVYLSQENGGFESPVVWASGIGIYAGDLRVGDFDGDGSDDLLWVDRWGSAGSPGLRWFRSNGSDAFDDQGLRLEWSGRGLDQALGFYVGDFDGDGISDFLSLADNYDFEVSLSANTGPDNWGGWGADAEDIRVGDFNGDGKDDLLWVDKTNKYPSDIPGYEYPGLQVSLSLGSTFTVAKMWKQWYGLGSSLGFYVGDFNGDGRDDFLNLNNTYDLEVALSSKHWSPDPAHWTNDNTNFSATQNWGSWGVDPEDMYVGNFGRAGGGLPKRGVQPARIALPEQKVLNLGNALGFRGLSGPLTIYDPSGRKVLRTVVQDRGTADISALPTGIYYLEISRYKTKFVKMRR